MMDRETAAKQGLPAPLSTPRSSPVKQMAVAVPNREWLPLHSARFLQLMKSLAMVYVMAYLITQRHQWQSMIRGKNLVFFSKMLLNQHMTVYVPRLLKSRCSQCSNHGYHTNVLVC